MPVIAASLPMILDPDGLASTLRPGFERTLAEHMAAERAARVADAIAAGLAQAMAGALRDAVAEIGAAMLEPSGLSEEDRAEVVAGIDTDLQEIIDGDPATRRELAELLADYVQTACNTSLVNFGRELLEASGVTVADGGDDAA